MIWMPSQAIRPRYKRGNRQQASRNAWKTSNPVSGDRLESKQEEDLAPAASRAQGGKQRQQESRQQHDGPERRMGMSVGHERRELADGTVILGKQGATFAGYIPAQANKNKNKNKTDDKDKPDNRTQQQPATPVAPSTTPVDSNSPESESKAKSAGARFVPNTPAEAAAAITAALGLQYSERSVGQVQHQATAPRSSSSGQRGQRMRPGEGDKGNKGKRCTTQ
ncbi:hypothetical protein F5Y17DRAFT_421356 [Xylariaceae sp. FL0594]|nr:hypothetical protein F5Y17DRAFT_421356 [Xylariaceae sp. FL0594]